MFQGYTFWTVGGRRAVLRDAYHSFLQLRWSASLILIGIGLLVANIAFATAYYLVGGVEGGDTSFFDMFSFSMQTMATIGYGVLHPTTVAAECVMIVEAIFGITQLPNGDLLLDLTKFDAIEPDPHASVAA